MPSIIPLSSFSNTEESSISATFEDTAVSIVGSSLLNGVEYLILYTVSSGTSDATTVAEQRVIFGSTTLAEGAERSSSSGTVNHCRGRALTGYFIITGNGIDTLKIQKRRAFATGTCFFGGFSLIAIPLDQLTEGEDYEQITQNADAAEVTFIAPGSADLITLTKTTEADNYLVLASCEVDPKTGGTLGCQTNVDIDGSNQKSIVDTFGLFLTGDYSGWSYARIHNLTAGSHTFKIEVAYAGVGTDPRRWRRGRIIIFKASVFDQLVSSIDDTQDTVGVNEPTEEEDNSIVYTPNQAEDVVILGNIIYKVQQTFRYTRSYLRNDTDSVEFSKSVGGDNPFSNIGEMFSNGMFGTENIALGANTYSIQRTDENNTTHNKVENSDIIVWSMTLSIPPPPPTIAASKKVTSIDTKHKPASTDTLHGVSSTGV